MKPLSILIAEDDADDRYLLEAAFTKIGMPDRLTFVEDGVELLKFFISEDGSTISAQDFPAFYFVGFEHA